MIYLTSFASDGRRGTTDCRGQQQRLHENGARWDLHAYPPPVGWSCDRLEAERPYWPLHAGLLTAARGAGFWAWKPYIILDALLHAADGDLVAYMDVSILWRDDPRPWLEKAREQGVFAPVYAEPNETWTRGDAFALMGLDAPRYRQRHQVWAAVVCFERHERTLRLVRDWLLACCQPGVVADGPSAGPNAAGFKDHRHDQSVLAILLEHYGIRAYECDHFWDG